MRCLGVVVIALAVLASAAGGETMPGGGGRIVFVSTRAPDLGRVRFAAVTPTGSRTLEIGIAPAGAALAPDRVRYAYVEHEAPSTWQLRVGDFGGSSVVVATHTYGIENPVWSPHGDWIAYTAINPASCGPGDHLCVTYELWVVRRYGGDQHKIADRAADPVWAPNSTLLAFAGEYETYAANDGWKGKPYVGSVNSTAVRRLVDVYGVDRISWSPNSDRVVVSAHRGFAAIASLRGGNARKIVSARAAVWSPKGDAIALARGKSIALVRPTGRLLRTIRTSNNVEAITWSPNTTQLAYLSKLPVGEPVPRTVPRRLLVTVSATGRSARTVARFDRFQLTKLLGWLREGYVLYQTTREVNDLDVFSAGSDGGDVRQLTDDDVPQVDPAWSPDGGRVVFSEGNAEFRRYELRTMLLGATTSTRLTVGAPDESDVEPAWSPDGTLIAFTRLAGATAFDANVFVVRSDGTGLAQVTHGGGRSPAWWPDGRHLVFSRTENFRPVLYTIAADGSGERRLFQGGWGAPSRDGSRIAYAALDTANQIGLWVANADGSEPRRIANDPASAPSWSPDGRTLVFQRSVAPAQGRLAIVDITGGDETVLAHVGADDEAPDWSRMP